VQNILEEDHREVADMIATIPYTGVADRQLNNGSVLYHDLCDYLEGLYHPSLQSTLAELSERHVQHIVDVSYLNDSMLLVTGDTE